MGVYVDNSKSAYSGKRRPPTSRCSPRSRAGNVDVLVAYSSDRIYRRLGDLERLVDELGSTQVATVRVGGSDLTHGGQRMTARILQQRRAAEPRSVAGASSAYEQRRAPRCRTSAAIDAGYRDASALVEG